MARHSIKRKGGDFRYAVVLENQYGDIVAELEPDDYGFYVLPYGALDAYRFDIGDELYVDEIETEI